jgi:hypothetical protein
LRPEGGRVVEGESGISKGIQKLDALVAQKAFTAKPAKRLVSEQLFGGAGIDVGNGKPPSVDVPDSSGSKAVDMWVWVDEASKSLRHGDDTGPSVLVVDGFAHQLAERLVGQTSEIGKKLPVVHEVRPEHLGESESEQFVSDVFEKLVLEKGGEGSGALGIRLRQGFGGTGRMTDRVPSVCN